LIEKVIVGNVRVTPDAASLGVSRIANQLTGGSVYKLGQLINFEHMVLHSWVRGKNKPALATLLEFCRRVNVFPDDLLAQQATLLGPVSVQYRERPRFAPRTNLDEKDRASVRKYLAKLIAKNPLHARSTTDVAQELHMTYTKLQYHFPREYKVLRQRYLAWMEKVVFNHAKHRERKLKEGVAWLRKRHVYPSERHLKQLTGVLPSDLRRSDIRRLLRRLRRDLPDLVTNKNGLVRGAVEKKKK
jgi:AraC-like DNA-binding protein